MGDFGDFGDLSLRYAIILHLRNLRRGDIGRDLAGISA